MKNFLYLFIFTAIFGLFLKFYFKSGIIDSNQSISINLSERVADSLFFDDIMGPKSFNTYLAYNHTKMESIFDISPYDNNQSKRYSLGNLYFKRYFEFIYARNLLSEINYNLFKNPALDRYVMLPLISSFENNNQISTLFTDFIDVNLSSTSTNLINNINSIPIPEEIISGNFTVSNPYCEDSNKLCDNDNECKNRNCVKSELYEISNPSLYDYYASTYLDLAIKNLEGYVISTSHYERKISSSIKLSLLYSKRKNTDKLNTIFNSNLGTDLLIEILNNNKDESILFGLLDIQIIDLFVELELLNIISTKDIKNIIEEINTDDLLKLYLLKREYNSLPLINNMPTYNCELIEDYFIGPEIMLMLSEINFRNNNLIDAENIMYDLWSNCSTEFDPRLDWMYDNYPATLMRSFRTSLWHGSLLPQFNKFFRKLHVNGDKNDPRFDSLNMAIKLWINATISFGLDESVGNN